MFRSMILANLGLSSGFNMAAPASRPAVRASSVQMGSIIDAAKETQGPEIFWGSAGVENGHLESEIRGYDGFGKFLAAVDAAGLTDTLKSGEYTVFAPTDEIITDFETNAGGKMTADVVKHHIVKGKVPTSAFSSADLTTVGGGSLQYRRQFRKDFINDATPGVQSEGPSKSSNWPANVECDNGIIHSCNAVLTPDWVDGAGGFNPRGN